MIQRLILLFFCAFLMPFIGFSQDTTLTEKDQKKLLNQAREYLRAQDFEGAFKAYSELHKLDTNNANYNYELGITIFEGSPNKLRSKKYFEAAERNGNRDEMPELFYYLGRLYHMEHNFLFATATYLVESLPGGAAGKKRKSEIEAYLDQCEMGKDLMEQEGEILETVEKKSKNISRFYIEDKKYVQLENLGEEINSKFSEYGPVIFENGKYMLFTSRRSGSTGGELYSDGQFFEDMYICINKSGLWTDVNNINNSPFFNNAILNHAGHNASVSLSPDETELFVYTENHIDVITWDGDKWLPAEKFSENFNRTGSSVTSVTISPDNSKMYVAAERFDCIGGRDLFYSEKNESGEWGELVTLGPTVNSEYNEDSPYLLNDTTLYFSSKGHSSIGGYDVFVTYLSAEGWTEPKNLQLPINSPFDEINYMMAHDGSHGYYASNRAGGYGEFDLYMITTGVEKEIDDSMLSSLEKVEEADSNSKRVLLVDDIELDKKGNLDPNSQAKTAKVTAALLADAGLTAQIVATASGPNAKQEAKFEETVYFGSNSKLVTEYSQNKLKKLVAFASENPNSTLYLSGHSDHVGNEAYNLELSGKRVESVAAYLQANGVKNPIRKEYFGESKPRVDIDEVKRDPTKLIYNRRVQIVIF